MMRAFRAVSVMLLLAAITAEAAFAQQAPCLRIGSSFGEKHSADDRVEANIRTVLTSLNLCVETVTGPPKRLTEALLRGEIDGELIRVREYGRAVADAAVLVEEPLAEANGYLVARAGIDLPETAEGDLTIGMLRGVRWHRAALENAGQTFVANDMEQLMEMLRNGRVDAILVGGFLRDDYPELAALSSKVVHKTTLHFVLHRSHADLAEKIGGAIRAFKSRGCSFQKEKGGPTCSDVGETEGRAPPDSLALLCSQIECGSEAFPATELKREPYSGRPAS
ncbi:hypothetical protein EOI86_06920 [Hwanghaeella grinnelliae]|uniref:Transporter substrate-binding domain-containing protein n=1 Tax=Hwanghaeella grinnelliae TaxID=2500179 RepID=A0A437QWS6_9PROT|nr:hypothetical protein [Hwanghaeella grinnelliae]RVU38985.1 hypothetical protein EOI86_06920 [Hwanghaeella grinnelliae]